MFKGNQRCVKISGNNRRVRGGIGTIEEGQAVGCSISWGESEKVRLSKGLKEVEDLAVQISGEVCSQQRKELQQRLQSKIVLGEQRNGTGLVEWTGVEWAG